MTAKRTVITINCRNFDKFIIAGIWTICLLFAVESQAAESLAEQKIPQALSVGLHHFLDLADPAKTVAFDPKKVAGVLDFINQPGMDAALYYADSILDAPSAYYEFDIHENLKKILAFCKIGTMGIRGMPKNCLHFYSKKNHWARMSKDEMESVLVIEYMKYAVGKTQPDEVRALLELKL
jgi:hypothetical protein